MFCPDRFDELAAMLDRFQTHFVRTGPRPCRSLHPNDVEVMPIGSGDMDDRSNGPGFFGSRDLDGDGTEDLILLYARGQVWRMLLFLREEACHRYVGYVDGYQAALLQKQHAGLRDMLIVLTPRHPGPALRRYDGTQYEPPRPCVCALSDHPWGNVSVVGPFPRAFTRTAPTGFATAHRLYVEARAQVKSGRWRELRGAPCGWRFDHAIGSKDDSAQAAVLDEQGQVRVYLEDGGGEESTNIARLYYDADGRPRFLFIQLRSMHLGTSEELFALDEHGAVVAKQGFVFDTDRVERWARGARPDALTNQDCDDPCPPCDE